MFIELNVYILDRKRKVIRREPDLSRKGEKKEKQEE